MSALKVPSRNSEGTAVLEHPSRYRVSFKGDTGEFEVYDKSTKEKQRISHDKFVFMPLIRTAGASGYYQPANMGYWSNEIQDSRTDILEVKGNDGSTFCKGLWKEIKEQCNARKIEFIGNLYAAVKISGNYEIAVIELKTTSLVAFGEFAKKLASEKGKSNAIYNVAVRVSALTPKKNGSVNYVVPTFTAQEVSPQGMEASGKLADTCIAYLEGYFSEQEEAQAAAPAASVPVQAPQATAAPAQVPAQQAPPPPMEEDLTAMYGEDPLAGGIDLGGDELPF
jgi:hypothetical protein